jgi:hypothetical protein
MPLRDSAGTLAQCKRIEFVVVAKISMLPGPEDGAGEITELPQYRKLKFYETKF